MCTMTRSAWYCKRSGPVQILPRPTAPTRVSLRLPDALLSLSGGYKCSAKEGGGAVASKGASVSPREAVDTRMYYRSLWVPLLSPARGAE